MATSGSDTAVKLILGMLRAGQKASKIAQLCRAEKSVFGILVQEKGRLKSNDLDFKTLADVFIQQVAKAELEKEFPGIGERVYGEENNEFTNTLGETICVKVEKTVEETSGLLGKVVDGNENAAKLLAGAAHEDVKIKSDQLTKEELQGINECEIDINQIAFWIDPIDGTSQYVKGIEEVQTDCHHIHKRGLQCVTVLIGAYNTESGVPVAGVIYQPFYEKQETRKWKERFLWGISHNGKHACNFKDIFENNIEQRSTQSDFLVVSSVNDKHICEQIPSIPGVELCTAGGAGYKSLCVILGLVDAFLYSDDACYKWDTCATQALCKVLGGNVVQLNEALACKSTECKMNEINSKQLTYNNKNPPPYSPWANVGGLIAFNNSVRSQDCVQKVVDCLAQKLALK